MEKSYETCEKCKYDYIRYCVNVEDCDNCDNCEMYDVHSKYLCKCFTIHYGEDCPYFVEAEEVDDNDGCSSNC